MPALEVAGLVVRYGQLTAVRGIDLTVGEGEIVVVLGANGAGKTSTMKAICGGLKPSAGKIAFEGADITGMASHRVVKHGMVAVPEGRRILAPLSVEENLMLGAYTLKSRVRRGELLEEMYELFPILRERKDMAGGLLSGGEQQMLAFGRALMADPKMLLLDEPSMGLAPVMVDAIMGAVARIARRGLSILMVEQNATAAFGIVERAYVLEHGEVVLEGPAEQVATDPLVLKAFLGVESADAPEDAAIVDVDRLGAR